MLDDSVAQVLRQVNILVFGTNCSSSFFHQGHLRRHSSGKDQLKQEPAGTKLIKGAVWALLWGGHLIGEPGLYAV